MTLQLQLNESVEITTGGSGRLYIRTPIEEFVIVDKAGLIAKVLDAVRDGSPLEDTMECFDDPEVRAEALDGILAMLRKRRVLTKATPRVAPTDPIHAWLSHIALKDDGVAPVCRLLGTGLLKDTLSRLLEDVGVRWNDDRDAPMSAEELIVACFDAPDEAVLRNVNRSAVEADAPLLPVILDRHVVAIGPFIVPRATACYECLYHRVRVGRRSAEAYETAPMRNHLPSRLAAHFAAASAAAEIVRFLAGTAFDLHTAGVTRHDLMSGISGHTVALKVPRCPACGGANLKRPLAPVCGSAPELAPELTGA